MLAAGTSGARYGQQIQWLLSGIHAAGPEPHAKTFKQGLFAIPPSGGAATGRTDTSMTGFAKTPKLPWDEYAMTASTSRRTGGTPNTEGPSNGLYIVGKGVGWYVDGAKRYVATTWPKKQFAWFDKSSVDPGVRQPPRRATSVRRRLHGLPVDRRSRSAGRAQQSWWCSRPVVRARRLRNRSVPWRDSMERRRRTRWNEWRSSRSTAM